MRNTHISIIIVSILCLLVSKSYSQNFVNQVLILNEGYYDYTNQQIVEPVTIGSYDPLSNLYSVVITIDSARFASDIIIDGDNIYVAADDKLLKYDLNNYNLIEQIDLIGARNLKISGDKIFVTRGEYMTTFDSYLHVYNKNDFSNIYQFDTITGPKWATQNMIIDNDFLYVAINNGFESGNEKGLIGVVDISNLSYINEIDLGPEGKNPDNLMKKGSKLFTVNNKDWTGMSISEVNLSLGSISTNTISSVSSGCGTSCLRNDKICYQSLGDTELYEWDGISSTSIGSLMNFYELASDTINNLLYTSSTDFFSSGTINVYDVNNLVINTFACGVSPGVIVFDVRSSLGIEEISNLKNQFLDKSFDLMGREINEDAWNGLYIKNNKKYMKIKD